MQAIKIDKIVRILLFAVALLSIIGLVYITHNKIPESCGSSLSPYANCIHYPYSEWQPFLMLLAITASLGLLGSFLVKNTKYKRMLAILLVAVTLMVAGFMLWGNKDQNSSDGLLSNSEGPQIITGHVTRTSDQCYSDGICSVTLDNTKTIITGCGLGPGGKTCKIYNQSKLRNGQRVEATVIQSDATTYNLECEPCTIRTLD